MAANMAQMGGRRPVQQQSNNLQTVVYNHIMKTPSLNTGWQANFNAHTRAQHVMNIITNSSLAIPEASQQQHLNGGITYEREVFANSPDKATYEARVNAHLTELFRKRQNNVANDPNVHPGGLMNNMQAAAQAQAQAQVQNQVQNQAQAHQMMMSQNMQQMRGLGQQPMQQNFQGFQHPMQPSVGQAGQPNMVMGNPNGVPMSANQQAMQMGVQMRPQMPIQAALANLPPQERTKVQQLAIARYNQTTEPQRSQFRLAAQQRFAPQTLAQLQQENIDPLMYWFQHQVLGGLRNTAGANQAALAMQAQQQQRPMNQSAQPMPTGPNGEYVPFTNVESIMNQQKAGLIAQEAGQMVVPASNGAVRNATPQPMGALPGPSPGTNQPAVPHQLPQQFTMDQRAAQTQSQIRAQAQAKQMQGQPGGLNGPGGVSQSPGLNTLNAPVNRPPNGVGPTENRPQMGQGTVPFGQQQMMDPRFHQLGQQRAAMTPNAGMQRNQTMLNNLIAQMPAETRQQMMALPPDKLAEMALKWNNSRMGGRPQSQLGQLGPGNSATQSVAQYNVGNNNGQQPNLGMVVNQQNQVMMQQQQQLNKVRNLTAPQAAAFMDNMVVHPKVFEGLRQLGQGIPPPEVQKWGQLKQWATQQNYPKATLLHLHNYQNAQFQNLMTKNAAGFSAGTSPAPQTNLPQHGMDANGQGTLQIGQPNPNIAGSNSGISITPEEFQTAKQHERFRGWPDEKIHRTLIELKANMRRNHMSNSQAQASQPPQVNHTIAASSLQPTNVATAPQRQPDPGFETTTFNKNALQGRSNKPSQTNRAPTNVPVAPPPKGSLKRPSSDDLNDIPNPSGAPAQRTPSQQAHAQPATSSVPAQVPQSNPEQLAAMTPEQRESLMMMQQLKNILLEEVRAAAAGHFEEISLTPDQLRDYMQKLRYLGPEVAKVAKAISRWYSITRDDSRARQFFRLRLCLFKQWTDGEHMTAFQENFTMAPEDLDSLTALIRHIVQELANAFPNMRKNPSQQNAPDATPTQGAITRPGAPPAQPSPLTGANLEKNHQAHTKIHNRAASRAGQPPAAPTTAQPPYLIVAQSPDGRPKYAGGPGLTQAGLTLPARKRTKTGTGPSPDGLSANPSPQVQKLSSPDLQKRPAATEAKPTPAKPQFQCTEPGCEWHNVDWHSEDALRKHIDQDHVKPAEDPSKYYSEALAMSLILDSDAKGKKMATTSGSLQVPEGASKELQTAMRRQGTATGSKPNEPIKTTSREAVTPKLDSALVPASGSGVETAGATVDPQSIMFNTTGIETGGNGAVDDMNLYRAMIAAETGGITPRDTPDSNRDSEPSSDVSEGVALSVNLDMNLDMGSDTWHPFPANRLGRPGQIMGDAEYDSLPCMAYPPYSWDDVPIDFGKPFAFDTSNYEWDPSSN